MMDTQIKDGIQSYFDGAGFESLRQVYGDEACDGFRRAIRRGHSEVVETVVSWLGPGQDSDVRSVLDAGCGTGALAVPLAGPPGPAARCPFPSACARLPLCLRAPRSRRRWCRRIAPVMRTRWPASGRERH